MGVASIPYGLPAQAAVVSPTEFKSCCAALYESDWAHLLLGESLHPGGLALTERLGVALGLGPDKKVLDAACGAGASAVFLAERFGCRVVGVDFSPRLIAAARARAADRSVSAQVD
ncbi:MAG: SAM-dependent methyltransferase, partial [Anaerolineales bacterium]